jgi:hypothetical protein
MSDQALTETTTAPARRENSKPGKVTGRLKRALDHIVYDCMTDNEAAVKTGMHVNAIRLALKRPHVRAYCREQRDVLLEREMARNIHRAVEIRDKADNMPAVQAIKLLKDWNTDDMPAGSRGSVSVPGLVVQIVMPSGGATIDAVPVDVTAKALK